MPTSYRSIRPGSAVNFNAPGTAVAADVSADGFSPVFKVEPNGDTVATFILARLQGSDVAGSANEVQTLTEGGAGLTSFTITYAGQTTASIDDDAVAATVQAALEALSNLAPGDVVVTGGPLATGPFTLTFGGTLANTNVAEVTTTPTGGSGTVVVATTNAGGDAALDVTLQGSFDQVSWYTIATAFTQATTTDFAESKTAGPIVLPTFLRATYDITGDGDFDFDLFVSLA